MKHSRKAASADWWTNIVNWTFTDIALKVLHSVIYLPCSMLNAYIWNLLIISMYIYLFIYLNLYKLTIKKYLLGIGVTIFKNIGTFT